MKFAKLIRSIRMIKGLTLKSVALRMGATTHGAYSQYEYGLKIPSKEQREKILKALR